MATKAEEKRLEKERKQAEKLEAEKDAFFNDFVEETCLVPYFVFSAVSEISDIPVVPYYGVFSELQPMAHVAFYIKGVPFVIV